MKDPFGDQLCNEPPGPTDPPLGPTNGCGCRRNNNWRRIAGCVQVEDDDFVGRQTVNVPGIGSREVAPVMGVEVIVWNGWFTVHSDHTNNQGCFEINHTYNDNKRVRIWLKWVNRNVSVNGWTPGTGSVYRIGVDRYLDPVRVTQANQLNNMHIVMTNIGDRRSRSQVWYRASHMLNGVERARQVCAERALPMPPQRLRVVISNAETGAGAAPMFRASGTDIGVVLTSCAAALAVLRVPPVGISFCAVSIAAHRLIPDIWQNYGNEAPATSGSRTTEVFMHEMGHAVHFTGVLPVDWNANVGFIIGLAIQFEISQNDPQFRAPYGDGTNPGSGWCATIEAWGEYYGATAHGIFYGPGWLEGEDDFRPGLEGFVPDFIGLPDGTQWLPQGLPLDLEDFANPAWEGMQVSPILPIDDEVGGLTMAAYYQAMLTAGIRPDPFQVRNRIITTALPPGQNAAAFTQAFQCYGY